MQHSMMGFAEAVVMLQAISTTPAIPMVRCPGLDALQIMRLLDAGAYGVICPMISTHAEAEALVSACRCPQAGRRSFGPSRGLLYGGSDYFTHANKEMLVLAMMTPARRWQTWMRSWRHRNWTAFLSGRTIWRLSSAAHPRQSTTTPRW